MRFRWMFLGVAVVLLATPSLAQAKRVKAKPRRIFGAEAWRVLKRATRAEVALIERKAGGSFRSLHGLTAVKTKRASKRWLRRARALFSNPRSYLRRRCELKGECSLKCKTTPRAVLTLEAGEQRAVAVITVCHNLQAGLSLATLGKQASMDPSEVRLLRLLRELFGDDAKLKQDLLDAKEAARAR